MCEIIGIARWSCDRDCYHLLSIHNGELSNNKETRESRQTFLSGRKNEFFEEGFFADLRGCIRLDKLR